MPEPERRCECRVHLHNGVTCISFKPIVVVKSLCDSVRGGDHGEITKCQLCLDREGVGREAIKKLQDMYVRGWEVSSDGRDISELLARAKALGMGV